MQKWSHLSDFKERKNLYCYLIFPRYLEDFQWRWLHTSKSLHMSQSGLWSAGINSFKFLLEIYPESGHNLIAGKTSFTSQIPRLADNVSLNMTIYACRSYNFTFYSLLWIRNESDALLSLHFSVAKKDTVARAVYLPQTSLVPGAWIWWLSQQRDSEEKRFLSCFSCFSSSFRATFRISARY